MIGAFPSLDGLRPNPDWAKLPLFDRKGWKRVHFGDVVENLNETERNPAEAGIERFIGLEHLEPGSLHIRKWGNVADGTTFTRRCRPGQVLFGKRRAYQRKMAVAEFDAVVSGDIYVLVPKSDRLLPKLLPFLCMSERFFQHAVGTSAGSLSPRTNWSSLASFEFDLPPLDQQRHIAKILWAADEAVEVWRKCVKEHAQSLHTYASALTMSGFRKTNTQPSPIGQIPISWQCLRIEELTTNSAYGPRFPGSQYSTDGNVRTLRTTDFDRAGGINFDKVPAANLEKKAVAHHLLMTGDFLISRSGEYAGLTALFSDPGDGKAYIPGAFLIRYRFDERLDSGYLLTLCCSTYGDEFLKPLAAGSAQPNISGSAFSRLFIPVPPIAEQKKIVQAVSQLRATGDVLTRHETKNRELEDSLVNILT